jgi:hypothetical protein
MPPKVRLTAAVSAVVLLAACQAPAPSAPPRAQPLPPPPQPGVVGQPAQVGTWPQQPAPGGMPGSSPVFQTGPGAFGQATPGASVTYGQTTTNGQSNTFGTSTTVTNPIPGGTMTQTAGQTSTQSSSTTTGFGFTTPAATPPPGVGAAVMPAMGGAWRLMNSGNSINCTVMFAETGPGTGTINAPAACFGYLHLRRYEFRGPNLVLVDSFGDAATLQSSGGYWQGRGKGGEGVILQR